MSKHGANHNETTHHGEVEGLVEAVLKPYPPFPVEEDHSQFTTGIYVPDVEALKENIRNLITTHSAKEREEERERHMANLIEMLAILNRGSIVRAKIILRDKIAALTPKDPLPPK